MRDSFDAIAAGRPHAARRILTLANLYALTVPAATMAALVTGHTLLAIIGVLACTGCYAAGYTVAALRLRDEVAQARTDPLTGLPNRALADEMLDQTTRSGAAITVALIDVNGLHTINANPGHAAGDQYLITVAQRLATAVPADGVLVRQGGDEFTLIAPGANPQDLANRIGAALAGRAVIAGCRIQPRASVGVAATDATGPTGVVDAGHARAAGTPRSSGPARATSWSARPWTACCGPETCRLRPPSAGVAASLAGSPARSAALPGSRRGAGCS